jgi:(p)ppGpp synthase/HD superfamily hydrolase
VTQKQRERTYVNLIEKALKIAVEAHAGKVDRAGRPYILPPLRLMMKLDDDPARAAALLHDVIEDTDHTAESLNAEGIPDEVVTAVVALTRRQGESYADFVERAAADPIARRAKIADLEDNMDLLRLETVADRDLKRLRKYHTAWNRLNRKQQ